jgi:hypothetical protein
MCGVAGDRPSTAGYRGPRCDRFPGRLYCRRQEGVCLEARPGARPRASEHRRVGSWPCERGWGSSNGCLPRAAWAPSASGIGVVLLAEEMRHMADLSPIDYGARLNSPEDSWPAFVEACNHALPTRSPVRIPGGPGDYYTLRPPASTPPIGGPQSGLCGSCFYGDPGGVKLLFPDTVCLTLTMTVPAC